ncbi:MAG: hypothetical protein L6R38_000770 [Xanthoria sp. 2 TBL-2021]|nr:MAG: hypothetical protein L6R38_000770 [Xanthoria sp. 2 TBL-2021]
MAPKKQAPRYRHASIRIRSVPARASAPLRSADKPPNWANAPDVGTLAKSVFGQLLRTVDPASPDPIRLDEITVLTAFNVVITERSEHAKDLVAKIPVQLHFPTQMTAPQTQNAPPPSNVGTQTCQPLPHTKDPPPEEQGPETRPPTPATRTSAAKPGRASSLTSRLGRP